MEEQELIRRCQSGDLKAFEPLFHAHIHIAVRSAYLIIRDWAMAEDAAQEAFVRAFQSIRKFRLGEPFRPWLYRIVVNEARRLMHKSRPLRSAIPAVSADEASQHTPEHFVLESERQSILERAMNNLSPNHRLVIILKYFTGLSEAEMANVIGIRPSTVKSRLYEARQRLVGLLKQ